MTTAEFVAAHADQLIYGPAYDPSTAPFPEALDVAPLVPFPAPKRTPRRVRTSTARRPRQSFIHRVAALLSL